MQTVIEAADILLALEPGDMLKVKEVPHLHRPAWNVWVKRVGQKRGKLIFTMVASRLYDGRWYMPPVLFPPNEGNTNG